MFDVFKFYDEMLGIYAETVMGSKDESEEPMVVLEYTVPEYLADDLDDAVKLWLIGRGVNVEQEDAR